MQEFWNERYQREEYIYGKDPNEYLKAKLENLTPGRILFPAEGEGRNAVHAAKKGWQVSAFDQSEEGRKKALRLAEAEGVEIDYTVSGLQNLSFKEAQFDAIAFVYAHFPPQQRQEFFSSAHKYLKEGGKVIFEGFASKHPQYQESNPAVGGPKEPEMLFSEEEIKNSFHDLHFLEFFEGEIELEEGAFHKGKGWVIRFVAEKKK